MAYDDQPWPVISMVLNWVTLKAEILMALGPLLEEKCSLEDKKAMHISNFNPRRRFKLDALIVRQLDADILAGKAFLTRIVIGVRLAKRKIATGVPLWHSFQCTLLSVLCGTIIPSHYAIQRTVIHITCDLLPDTPWALKPQLAHYEYDWIQYA